MDCVRLAGRGGIEIEAGKKARPAVGYQLVGGGNVRDAGVACAIGDD